MASQPTDRRSVFVPSTDPDAVFDATRPLDAVSFPNVRTPVDVDRIVDRLADAVGHGDFEHHLGTLAESAR